VGENCCLKNLARKTVVFLGLILSTLGFVRAQGIPLGTAEINASSGLHSNQVRQIETDPDGAVWACHSAGVQVFPENNPAKLAISRRLKGVPIWDIAFFKADTQRLIAALSFDSGLYVFNVHGQLIQRKRLKKSRKLVQLEGKLFCLSSEGVFQIYKNSLKRITPAAPASNQISCFFRWRGDYYTCAYPSNQWLISNHIPASASATWSKQAPFSLPLSPLSAAVVNNALYVGLINQYLCVSPNGLQKSYRIENDPADKWAIWDFTAVEQEVFLCLGNVENLEQGALVRHESQRQNISLAHSHSPFLWGLSYDAKNHALWTASMGKGAFLLLFPSTWEPMPKGQIWENVHQNLQFITNGNILYYTSHHDNSGWRTAQWWQHKVKPISTQALERTWKSIACPGRILHVSHLQNQTYLLTSLGLYRVDIDQSTLELVSTFGKRRYRQLIPLDKQFLLFGPYARWQLLNPQTGQLSTWLESPTQTSRFYRSALGLFAQNFNGELFSVKPGKISKLQWDRSTIPYDAPLHFAQNYLIAETEQKLLLFKIDALGNRVQFLRSTSLPSLVPQGQHYRIFVNNRGCWISSESHIYLLDLNSFSTIVSQQYTGRLSTAELETATMNETEFLYHSAGMLHTLPLPVPDNRHPHHSWYVSSTSAAATPISNMSISIARGDHFQIEHFPESYLNGTKQLASINLIDDLGKSVYSRVFVSSQGTFVSGLSDITYGLFLSSTGMTTSTFIRNHPKYGLAFVYLIVLVSIAAFILINRNRQLVLNSQLSELQLKVLKSNLNPHFVFNSMSLVQSLIIRNEPRLAIQTIGKIANINRLYLETNEREVNTLQAELEFARRYIELEKLRFEDAPFEYRELIDPRIELADWHLPPLLLQPVIENSVKHGLTLHGKGGELLLNVESIESNTKAIAIRISNTGPGPQFKRQHGTRMGSAIVQERLGLFNQRYEGKYWAEAEAGFNPLNSKMYTFTLVLKKP